MYVKIKDYISYFMKLKIFWKRIGIQIQLEYDGKRKRTNFGKN